MANGAAASPSAPGLAARRRALGQLLVSLVILVPAAVLALCSVSADLVAAVGGDPGGLWTVLPGGPVSGDWISAEISSTAFFLIALGVGRRKRTAWRLALAVMAGAIVVQGVTLDHPVSGLLAAAVAAILIGTRKRYGVASSPRETRLALALIAGASALAIASAVTGVGTATPGDGLPLIRALRDAIGGLFDLATPIAIPGVAAIGTLLVLARLAFLGATVVLLDPAPDERSPAAIAAARRTLRRVGSGSLFPYEAMSLCAPFADEDGTAAMAAATVGRTSVAMSDPAGDPGAADALFGQWACDARRRDMVPAVYRASAAFARRLALSGWAAVPMGGEAVVDPATFDLGGSGLAHLRDAVSRAQRAGVRTIWSSSGVRGLISPTMLQALIRLDADWHRAGGREFGLAVGRFDPDGTEDAAIAVAVDAQGAPIAFAVLRPTGADEGWVLDVMRQAPDGVPGAVDAALVTAITALGEDGVTRLSLGLAPLAGLDPRGGSRAERLLARGTRLVRPVHDFERAASFRAQFAPVWEARYLVLPSWTSLPGTVVALLRLHLGGSWARVLRAVAGGVWPAPARRLAR